MQRRESQLDHEEVDAEAKELAILGNAGALPTGEHGSDHCLQFVEFGRGNGHRR